jgi:hypothetical protein
VQNYNERLKSMSFSFDFNKYKKHDPREYSDLIDDEYDYEYSEEFIFEDEFGDEGRYDV